MSTKLLKVKLKGSTMPKDNSTLIFQSEGLMIPIMQNDYTKSQIIGGVLFVDITVIY